MSKAKARLSLVPELFRRVPAKFVVPLLIVVAALVWIAAFTVPDNQLHVFFLDVGQGDAIRRKKGRQTT